jgi:hypothetical protein
MMVSADHPPHRLEAPLLVGKTVRREFSRLLAAAGFQPSDVLPWQMDYDLGWAHKPWQ